MDCRTVHDQLSTYLDEDVPLQARLMLDQHFESCPQCCNELAQLHTVTSWVRDFPLIEPSRMFLPRVRERVERLPNQSQPPFFRRLTAALPVQVAAALAVVVSAALTWQMVPRLWQKPVQDVDLPAHIEPWSSHERNMMPILNGQPLESPLEESFPTPAPLVQAPPTRSGSLVREAFVRFGRETPVIPLFAGIQAEARVSELSFFPSLTLRAIDPVQTAQQIWELVPKTGGALLQSQGMITPAGRASRSPVRLTLSITVDRYQTLLGAIRLLPGTVVTEERMAIVGRELPVGSTPSLWRVEHAQPAKAAMMTLVLTILPR